MSDTTAIQETGTALRQEYEQGAGIATLSRRYRMSFRGVRQALLRQGAALRKPGLPAGTPRLRHHNRKVPMERIADLLALFDSGGMTEQAIGQRMGITRQRVSQIAREHGRSRA